MREQVCGYLHAKCTSEVLEATLPIRVPSICSPGEMQVNVHVGTKNMGICLCNVCIVCDFVFKMIVSFSGICFGYN